MVTPSGLDGGQCQLVHVGARGLRHLHRLRLFHPGWLDARASLAGEPGNDLLLHEPLEHRFDKHRRELRGQRLLFHSKTRPLRRQSNGTVNLTVMGSGSATSLHSSSCRAPDTTRSPGFDLAGDGAYGRLVRQLLVVTTDMSGTYRYPTSNINVGIGGIFGSACSVQHARPASQSIFRLTTTTRDTRGFSSACPRWCLLRHPA